MGLGDDFVKKTNPGESSHGHICNGFCIDLLKQSSLDGSDAQICNGVGIDFALDRRGR